ncbi:transglycosylase SLT domain-containing protein [Nonomuraea sp. NN258]|nr:transglycosylase SLT domain-containing protein [Nonomuraea antri]
MRAYPRAGESLSEAVTACANALDTAADNLEEAHAKIDRLHRDAVESKGRYERDFKKLNPDASQADLESSMAGSTVLSGSVTTAESIVSQAEKDLGTAKSALSKQLGEDGEFGFFANIPVPGGPDFDPGDKKVEWIRTPIEDGRTSLSSANGSGGGGGGGGGGGYGYTGGVSSAGNVPAPKAEVVEWIKQALTVIKSPEMAAVLRARGLNVSDLDPNDPKDVQRIWTIIHHESGGNPSAINNWDINAKNGVPSQGLMQTIPPTFNAHSLPGYKKILEPVDNIIAGVLYTYSRYGDLGRHPGIASLERGGGYRPY